VVGPSAREHLEAIIVSVINA
jgi:hypothetical protein